MFQTKAHLNLAHAWLICVLLLLKFVMQIFFSCFRERDEKQVHSDFLTMLVETSTTWI